MVESRESLAPLKLRGAIRTYSQMNGPMYRLYLTLGEIKRKAW